MVDCVWFGRKWSRPNRETKMVSLQGLRKAIRRLRISFLGSGIPLWTVNSKTNTEGLSITTMFLKIFYYCSSYTFRFTLKPSSGTNVATVLCSSWEVFPKSLQYKGNYSLMYPFIEPKHLRAYNSCSHIRIITTELEYQLIVTTIT